MQLKDAQLFRQQAYIDGAWVDADGGQTIKVNNPATGEIIGTVPKMGAVETRRAIEAADKALPAWRALTAKERATKLRRWFELLIENQDDLGRLMTLEQGKPLTEAKGEIVYAASFIEWFAEEAKRIYGDVIPGHQPDKRLIVIKQPIGVTAAITPWNFPAAMITRKAGPALAAGCTMVIKPASQTPFSALALVELAHRAGIPKGVLSVVTGSAGDIGGELTSNPIVRKLSFTGSTEVGRVLLAQCAETIKKTSMELGGNAPFIVFDDADVDAAVAGAIAAKYRNTGQTCVCANRLFVQDGVYDVFAAKLIEAVRALRHQLLADRGGAGEAELAHLRVAGHFAADRGGIMPGDDVQHAIRQPGTLRDDADGECGIRRLDRRLADHGASCGQRRADLAPEHRRRKIPRRDHRHHAHRLAPDHDAFVGGVTRNDVAVHALGFFAEPLQEAGRIRHFAARFRQRLALLGGHQSRQVLLVLQHQVGHAPQHLRALLGGPA